MDVNSENDFELICTTEDDNLIEITVEYVNKNPKAKRKYQKCDPKTLELAVKAKLNGLSYRDASSIYNVSKASMENKIKGKKTGKWGKI
jgi:hypothetical protein